MIEKFPIWREICISNFMKFTDQQTKQLREILSETHYDKTVKNKRKKKKSKEENLKNSKEKACNLQGKTHEAINRFVSRSLISQERVGWYIQHAIRKKLPMKNASPSKVILQNKNTLLDNKSWGCSSSLILPYKKCWKEFLQLKRRYANS